MLEDSEFSEENDSMKEVPLKSGSPCSNHSSDDTGGNLVVTISNAIIEHVQVKFTVNTKTTLASFPKPEMTVVRQHEEFVWLHDCLQECADYASFLIPPAPPRPDFTASCEKLKRLGESQANITKDEFNNTKQELEQEYLAAFKKTVAMHETFLTRLASHPVFRNDHNFCIFLQYEQDLSVRGKNRKERLESLVRSLSTSTDKLVLQATQRDIDQWFEAEKAYTLVYCDQIHEATERGDKLTRHVKNLANSYISVSHEVLGLAAVNCSSSSSGSGGSSSGGGSRQMQRFLSWAASAYDLVRKSENSVASDYDLKLSDTMRYYWRETEAVKALLFRRLRCLADYEHANKQLERARARSREIRCSETLQQNACEKFESISEKAKEELIEFKKRRVATFKKHLIALCELQTHHAKVQCDSIKDSIEKLKAL